MAFFGRGQNTIQNPYTFKHMYQDYIKDKNEHSPYYVTYLEFVELCSEYIKRIMDLILNKNYEFKIPYRLGYCKIVKRKVNNRSKNAPFDWEATNKIGKIVRHMNDHTNGYKYFFKWSKGNIIFKYNWLYRLVFTRSNKREMARLIKHENMDYYEEK